MDVKIISFATLKGGSGKTTLLMLTAAALHNRTGKKVLVIDSDPQRSVKDIFEQEQHPNPFDVFHFDWRLRNPEAYFERVVKLARAKYDIILMDVPGKSVKDVEMRFSLLISDYLIVPIVASTLDINATSMFLKSIPTIIEERGRPLEVFGAINKKDQTIEHKNLRALAGIGGMEIFYSPLSNLARYKRNLSTGTDITDPSDPEDEFNRYFDEFCTKCFID